MGRRFSVAIVVTALTLLLAPASTSWATHCLGQLGGNPHNPVPDIGGVTSGRPIGYVDASGTIGFTAYSAGAAIPVGGCALTSIVTCELGAISENPNDPNPKIGGVNDPGPVGFVDASGTVGYVVWTGLDAVFCPFAPIN